jgi:hypothetical protein
MDERLDQALADVGEERPQHHHLERSLEHREPGLGGVDGHAEIAREIRQAQELAAPGSQRAEKALEGRQVANECRSTMSRFGSATSSG